MLRRDLIDVAARTACHGHGHITLHLPTAGPRTGLDQPLEAARGPPAQAA
jgi:hypothetical protein